MKRINMHQDPTTKSGLFLFVLFLLCLFASSLYAAEYNRIYNFEQPKIITRSDGMQLLELLDTRQMDDIVGAPILPVKTSRIFIPATEVVVSIDIEYGILQTIEGSYQIQHVTAAYPLSFQGQVSVTKPTPAIYKTNDFYPSNVLRSMGQQFLHGAKIVWVDLMPVLYKPAAGQLKYYENLQVKVRTTQRQKIEQVMPFKNSIENRNSILDTIENKDDFLIHHPQSEYEKSKSTLPMAEGLSLEDDSREYVVITTRDLASAFQTLVNHRASNDGGGYTTHIAYIDDIDNSYSGIDLAEKMRNFIKEMYTNHGTRYVLLGGDSDGSPENHAIPTRLVYARVGDFIDAHIPSDLYFGCLDGSWNDDGDEFWGELNDGVDGGDIDWFSEVYVGRIPADDYSEAINQINKIIAFETQCC